MLVSPPPPAVPRWMVTNSRITFRSPIVTRVGSPPNFRSCGTSPIEVIGKIWLPSPISVTPSITHDAPIRQSRPIVHALADRDVGADHRAGADRRADGWTIAVGWMSAVARLPAPTGSSPITSSASAATLPLMLATAFARAIDSRRGPIVTSSVSRSPGTTGSRNFALSTPRSQAPDDRRAAGRVHQQDGRDLRQRLDHEHARHQRRAGKMPLEEILVDGDVLDRLDPPPGLVLGDGVNQRRGIAVAEAVEGLRDVDQDTEASVSEMLERCWKCWRC